MKLRVGPAPFGEPVETQFTVPLNKVFVETMAAVLSVALYGFGCWAWPVRPDFGDFIERPGFYGACFVLMLLILLFLHEFLHLAVNRKALLSSNTQIGFDTKKFFAYAYDKTDKGWWLTLASLLAPFTFLTIVPVWIQLTYGLPSGWLGFAAIFNAGMSGNDLVMAAYMTAKVPKDARVVRPAMDRIGYDM
jgi:Putative zincin peptidase